MLSATAFGPVTALRPVTAAPTDARISPAETQDFSGHYTGEWETTVNPNYPPPSVGLGAFCLGIIPIEFDVTHDGAFIEFTFTGEGGATRARGTISPSVDGSARFEVAVEGQATGGSFTSSGGLVQVRFDSPPTVATDECISEIRGTRTSEATDRTPTPSLPPSKQADRKAEGELLEALGLLEISAAATCPSPTFQLAECDRSEAFAEDVRAALSARHPDRAEFDPLPLTWLRAAARVGSLRMPDGRARFPAVAALLPVFVRLADKALTATENGNTAEAQSLETTMGRLLVLVGKAQMSALKGPS